MGAKEKIDTTTMLKIPVENKHNEEGKKYYIFNQTGNIMISTTVTEDTEISKEAKDVFAETSVFFAGMTRAITTTPNPHDNGNPYSIYNYHALESIIGGSGLFVHVTEEDLIHTTKKFGTEFSEDLIKGLLGLATGAGALSFAEAMISSMGKEALRINSSSESQESKVGNIVFVCEYLMGVPLVTAIVVYIDSKAHKQTINIGPCFKETSTSTTLKMHKDTYLFVPPSFIKNYAKDLDSVKYNAEYVDFINWLQILLERKMYVEGLYKGEMEDFTPIKSGETISGGKYFMMGDFFPEERGSLKVDDQAANVKFTISNWTSKLIEFSVSGETKNTVPITIMNKDNKPIGSIPGKYKISKS